MILEARSAEIAMETRIKWHSYPLLDKKEILSSTEVVEAYLN
jgi:hypothetical protein